MTRRWETSPMTGPTVRRMWCPECGAQFSFVPPVWLGDPWPREAAEGVQRGHMELAHGEAAS